MIETWYNQELSEPVKVQYLHGNMFSQDNNGNLIGVNVLQNGQAAIIAGTVSASVIRADGSTVAVSGTRSGNRCSVTLPQACYAVPGVLSVVIKLTNGEMVTTLCAVVANVYRTATDTVVDPGMVIPDIAALIESIEQAVDSIPLDYSALSNGFRDAMETAYGLSAPGTFSSYTIKRSDGTTASSTAYKITDFIPVTGEEVIYTTSPTANATVLSERATIAFYSTNAASGYISSEPFTSGTQASILWQSTKVPTGAKYMRICIEGTLTAQFRCIQVFPIADIEKAIKQTGQNNIEYMADIRNKYVTREGTEAGNGLIRCSDYIPLNVNAVKVRIYAKAGNNVVYPSVCFYDSSKTFLAYREPTTVDSSGIVQYNLMTSADIKNARYIRFNQSNVVSDADKCLFELISIPIHVQKSANLAQTNVGADDIEPNGIMYRFDSGNESNLPYSGWLGNMFSVYGGDGTADSSGAGVLALGHGGRMHFRDNWGSPKAWRNWDEVVIDKTQRFSGAFESTPTVVDTGINLEPNTPYVVHFNSAITGLINIYGAGNTSNVARVNANKSEAIFKTDGTQRKLYLYNYDGNADSIDLVVAPLRSMVTPVKKYYVSLTDPMADYSSFTQCLLDLKNDFSEKIIYVDGGDYDIFAEYEAAGVPAYTGSDPTYDYFDYCVWVPKNTHIIGRGIVRLMWMPDAEDVTYNQSATVSPLNVAASCTIENIEVHCKNGRYCLHNDALGKAGYVGAIQIYKNVRFVKYANDTGLGWTHTIGFGIDQEMRNEYINCDFINETTGRAFYGHTRNTVGGVTMTEAKSSDIFVTDCVIDAQGTECVKLANVTNTALHVRTRFAGCYIRGLVNIADSTAGTNARNAFDVTFLNCGNVTAHVDDSSNPYPIKAYNTTVTNA